MKVTLKKVICKSIKDEKKLEIYQKFIPEMTGNEIGHWKILNCR